jgi:hypothetical protein
MTSGINAVKIHLKIDAEIDIAPIHSHLVLQHMTEIIKHISELDHIGGKRQITSTFGLDYHPVVEEDFPSNIRSRAPMTPHPQQEKMFQVSERALKLIDLYLRDDQNNQKYPSFIDALYSHPIKTHTPAAPSIDVTKCFEEKIFDVAPWKIYRQDAGMGEHDYAVMLNDVFFCRVEHEQHAHEIIRAIRFAANTKNAEAREATIRNATLDDVYSSTLQYEQEGIPGCNDKSCSAEDDPYPCTKCIVEYVTKSLRSTPSTEAP